jgi:hypothetical protein
VPELCPEDAHFVEADLSGLIPLVEDSNSFWIGDEEDNE